MAIFGLIRWDAWYQWGAADVSGEQQKMFSVAGLQFRAPWFAQVASPYLLKCIGTQANVNTEIQMAATAGIDYFAFMNYQTGSPLGYADPNVSVAWNYYQASPNKTLVKWCWMTQENHWGSTTFSDNTWQSFLNNIATTQCTQTNYQKVLTNRPLVFVFNYYGTVVSTVNMATAISYFRSRCIAAGLGTPYMVMQTDDTSISGAAARATACGFDAVSNYAIAAVAAEPPTGGDYNVLDTAVKNRWAAQIAAGKVLPCGVSGWDLRTRYRCPEGNSHAMPRIGDGLYWMAPSPARVAQHIGDLMTFVTGHAAQCDAQAALLYSWDECTEGGNALIPTLGDPPVSGSTNMLTAVKAVLRP